MKTRDLGIGSGGRGLLCLFVVIAGKIRRLYTCAAPCLASTRPRTIRAKSMKGSGRGGASFVEQTNENTCGRLTARISEPTSAAKRDVSGRAAKSCAPYPLLVLPGELRQLL